jgi:ubiquinone/menaquinone biosynthesis C-methylase UbiE
VVNLRISRIAGLSIGISPGHWNTADHVLDVACGNGNTAITARRMTGAKKVTGIDITSELLVQAREQTSIDEVNDIDWKEAN